LKVIFLFIVLFLSFMNPMTISFSQNADWKGTIEYEHGIEIIKNPSEPRYGEIAFELTEDLSIEDKDNADYFFQWLVDLDIDSNGNIFVLDKQQCKILIFDREGQYLQSIGGKGQGPGEFISPKKLILDHNDHINVLEDRRLHKFDAKAEFAKLLNFKYYLMTCSLFANGEVLALANEMNPQGLTQRCLFLNPEGEITKTLAEHIIAMDRLDTPGSSPGFGMTLHLCPSENDHAVFGNSIENRLYLIDASGKIVRIIGKDEQQKREIYFTGLFTNENGLIFVDKWGIRKEKGEPSSLDIFSVEGNYLYRAYTNEIYTQIIKKEFLYALETDSETGAQYIKRYKIKNWNLIKKGK